jgi:hypothetical protein
MADNTIGLKYHKCPTFDGQAEKFLTWYFKFGILRIIKDSSGPSPRRSMLKCLCKKIPLVTPTQEWRTKGRSSHG